MLLGAAGIPHYFPSFFDSYSRNSLVYGLSVAAIAFYVVHYFSERAISYGVNSGSEAILKKNKKVALFENQNDVACQGYRRYARSVSSSCFLLLVAFVLAYAYPLLLLFLFFYFLFVFFILITLYRISSGAKRYLDDTPGKAMSSLSGVGFLASFVFIVVDFLYGDPPSLLVAVISLILMRQGFSRFSEVVNDIKGMHSQQAKLNALFFHGHVLVNVPSKAEIGFWSLLEPPQVEKWIYNVLANILEVENKKIEIEWQQLGVSDVAAFVVKVIDDRMCVSGQYLVKLYNSNKRSLSQHEATLLLEGRGLPSLSLLAVESVQGLPCHIMECEKVEYESDMHSRNAETLQLEILASLISNSPSDQIVSRFSRSRPYLWQRIDYHFLHRLKVVASMLGQEELRAVEELCDNFEKVVVRLKNLPVVIYNPDLGAESCMRNSNGQALAAHWGRWSLEPVGAGWPTKSKSMKVLRETLHNAKMDNEHLKDVEKKDVSLAALMFSMESLYKRQKFISAIELIPRVLNCLR